MTLDPRLDKYIQAGVTSSTEVVARASYSLSQRTSVYSSVGYLINGRGGSTSVVAGGTVAPGAHQLGVMLGVRHAF